MGWTTAALLTLPVTGFTGYWVQRLVSLMDERREGMHMVTKCRCPSCVEFIRELRKAKRAGKEQG